MRLDAAVLNWGEPDGTRSVKPMAARCSVFDMALTVEAFRQFGYEYQRALG
jgi:hypothetical protein